MTNSSPNADANLEEGVKMGCEPNAGGVKEDMRERGRHVTDGLFHGQKEFNGSGRGSSSPEELQSILAEFDLGRDE